MNHDPQEDDPKLKILIDEAGDEAEAMLASHELQGQFGFCHVYWETKRQILLSRHGIEWRSPAEMNEDTTFD